MRKSFRSTLGWGLMALTLTNWWPKAFAKTSSPLTVRAEFTSQGKRFQHAIKYQKNGDRLEVGLNNNFLCGRFPKSRIGRFNVKRPGEYKSLLKALEHASEAFGDTRNFHAEFPDRHQVNWFLRRRNVSGNMGYVHLAETLLMRTCADDGLVPFNAVLGSLEKGKVALEFYEKGSLVKKEVKGLQDLECRLSGTSKVSGAKLYACEIPKMGLMSLAQKGGK